YCNVQLSWCGNQEIHIDSLVMFDGEFSKEIEQKYRVYMNYCTLDYSMCWWDFERWEKEIDFMAMNGTNMPLAVVGTEAVWYETLLEFGFTKEEALSTISGPSFWAWQLMTNIEGYLPPEDEKYIYEHLELGRKILARYIEFGMQPIQQGFSGHVPVLMKKKFPEAKILMQKGWCYYPETAQLDPLDPMFKKFGTVYLQKLTKLFGNHHFIACDLFHEGTPPKKGKKYLNDVGHTIDRMYAEFDSQSVWVMQTWTMRKHIVRAVPKERLLLLDLNSERTFQHRNVWGYPVVAGMLHDFGGKNAMQGKLVRHSKNTYRKMKTVGANAVGSGLFMEGIEQNPVVYDLQFELLTTANKIDLSEWLDNYIKRRYGKWNAVLREAFDLLLKTCYASNSKYHENNVGSMVAAPPHIFPKLMGAGGKAELFYDPEIFEKAVALFFSVHNEFSESDGYQYDLCDLVHQALSNRFYMQQQSFAQAYKNKDVESCKRIAEKQLDLLMDLDEVLSHRRELCFARWINDSHSLAANDEQKRYFDWNARTLLTLWGDIRGKTSGLQDYAWREWSGLIKEYYYKRWQMFYEGSVEILEKMGKTRILKINGSYTKQAQPYFDELNRKIYAFELEWGKTYSEYNTAVNSDVIPSAEVYIKKWLYK
ncbi:MAG: alpha-N-acetylglucosaminidase, partial [Eubacterium sp.]